MQSVRVLILGTDSASGKRTTAWVLRNALRDKGLSAEMIGTGQTAWMQGARFGIRMDSLVNDFVAGEIEHVVRRAWEEAAPDVVVVEGQGALLHPAYPGGLELVPLFSPTFSCFKMSLPEKPLMGLMTYRCLQWSDSSRRWKCFPAGRSMP